MTLSNMVDALILLVAREKIRIVLSLLSKKKAPASVYDIGKVKFSYSQKFQKKLKSYHGENKPISS